MVAGAGFEAATFGLSRGASCGARNLLLAVCCARFRPQPFRILPCSATGSGRTRHPTSYAHGHEKNSPLVDDEFIFGRGGALKTVFDASACQVKRKESRRELRPDSVWWLRELDLNQRPSGYRSAPVAVPEICCLQFAAPDFDRSPSESSLVLPQAAVGLVTQRATLTGMKKTHRWLTMSLYLEGAVL